MDLKALREDRELSQQALADLSGIPRRTIQDIERRGDCRVSTAIKLAEFFGITLDELCKGEPKK
ncbi:MAG: helix-turn-helix transcriptional regulator [Mobilibacterium timonense]|uniref:helix-turn-helix transcriptional regulator n=1 Tax=Mobilibacterium timonense TaxID=1871012 RepID=UPI0009848B84|nr:helix-turn-helix transcriptional regulator [Mobilibacterium timonense]MBM6991409.1 helix-turn-helix transcriptional regulator [Mobilibacterium timonense]